MAEVAGTSVPRLPDLEDRFCHPDRNRLWDESGRRADERCYRLVSSSPAAEQGFIAALLSHREVTIVIVMRGVTPPETLVSRVTRTKHDL